MSNLNRLHDRRAFDTDARLAVYLASRLQIHNAPTPQSPSTRPLSASITQSPRRAVRFATPEYESVDLPHSESLPTPHGNSYDEPVLPSSPGSWPPPFRDFHPRDPSGDHWVYASAHHQDDIPPRRSSRAYTPVNHASGRQQHMRNASDPEASGQNTYRGARADTPYNRNQQLSLPYDPRSTSRTPQQHQQQWSRPSPAPTRHSDINAMQSSPAPFNFTNTHPDSSGNFSNTLSPAGYPSPPLPSATYRAALTLTTSNLRMSESAQVLRVEAYLAQQPLGSTDNALEINVSKDVLEDGDTMQRTFQYIKGFLHRFVKISISLREEPDSPVPGGTLPVDDGLLIGDFDDLCTNRGRSCVDLSAAVNLKEFEWKGSFQTLSQTITGLPRDTLTSLSITGCRVSITDAGTFVKFLPNLESLEIDMIDKAAYDYLQFTPLLRPTLSSFSRISLLKVSSSDRLQRFLRDIRFLESDVVLESVQLVPCGSSSAILPDKASWDDRLRNQRQRGNSPQGL